MVNMKNDFISAYVKMYGESKKKAESVYRRAMEIADYGYIKEIINCVEENGCTQMSMFGRDSA